MTPTDKPLNPFEPSTIDPVDLRTVDWEKSDATVRSCQVIVLGLAMGISIYAGVVLFGSGLGTLNFVPTFTGIIGAFVALSGIAFSFAIPMLIGTLSASRLSKSQEPSSEIIKKLFATYQAQLILGCAFLEGAGFLNVFLFQASRGVVSLASLVICIGLLFLRIPTKWRVQSWIANRMPVSR